MNKLEGKVAIVSGAGSGMGRAVSLLFSEEGAKVVVSDIHEGNGKETVAMIRGKGGEGLFVSCDISNSKQVQEMVNATVKAFGRLDILYNNAARNRPQTPVPETVAEMPEEHWYGTLNTNLSGYYLCSKYALPEIIKGGGGVIINVSSIVGLVADRNEGAYGASKTGVIALTKSMAMDYGPKGVRVNAICPGSIDTPRGRLYTQTYRGGWADHEERIKRRVPLGRIGRPEEIARVALFLASDDSSYVTGVCIPVDGGWVAGDMW